MTHARIAAESLVGELPPPPQRPGRAAAAATFASAAWLGSPAAPSPLSLAAGASMALGGYRLWRAPDGPNRSTALAIWVSRLATGAFWPRPEVLVALDAALVTASRKVDGAAAALFLPDLAWTALDLTSGNGAR
jgi:hypothetical protein